MIKIFISLFIIILFFIISPLSRAGVWFYQDGSFWPKNFYEIYSYFNAQFFIYSTQFYYHGYDLGLFAYNKILLNTIFLLLIYTFGSELSQSITILLGFIASFLSFYFFSSIFIKDNIKRIAASFLYIFNPFFYSLLNEDYLWIYAAIPMYIYSFYAFFKSKNLRLLFVFINVLSLLTINAYIRFIPIAFILSASYIIYLFFAKYIFFKKNRFISLTIISILSVLPTFYSLILQYLANNQTAFYYASIFSSPNTVNFAKVISFFQTINIPLYNEHYWRILGYAPIIGLVCLIIKNKKLAPIHIFNLFLIILSLSLFILDKIVGPNLASLLYKFLPFTLNSAYWSYYLLNIPFLLLLSLLANRIFIIVYSVLIILIGLIPFFDGSYSFVFRKQNINDLPADYKKYFIDKINLFTESAYYIPGTCWRDKYMEKKQLPTMCFNFGTNFKPIEYGNPRLLSDVAYNFSNNLNREHYFDNLRFTHNLRSIFLATDIVPAKGPGPLHGKKSIENLKKVQDKLFLNSNLNATRESNFIKFEYNYKDDYDFLLYSPTYLIDIKEYDNIFRKYDISLEDGDIPLFVDDKLNIEDFQNVGIFYKHSQLDPTKYIIEINKNDNIKPFIIQLNQSYYDSWKLYWIDKQTFDEYACDDEIKIYKLSNNRSCLVKTKYLDFPFIANDKLSNEFKLKGNLFGNTWIIDNKALPDRFFNESNLYAIIIYEKQIIYAYTVIIAIGTMLLLVVLTILQEVKKIYENRKNH